MKQKQKDIQKKKEEEEKLHQIKLQKEQLMNEKLL